MSTIPFESDPSPLWRRTFVQEAVGVHMGYTYSRSGNPTVAAPETNAGNALRIETTDGGGLDLTAQGAGRWPTCEAVMADLFDLAAAQETVEAEEGVA